MNHIVSVVMMTYGHEKYIEEAINGVFIQQTDFPVELIIANDYSPDQTDEVVNSLLSRAPENITVSYTSHRTNKGMHANFLWAAAQAAGKYIALCEGDDYWTDPLKLQKQVDFLEANEEYIVHSGAVQVLEDKKFLQNIGHYDEQSFMMKDFLTKNNLLTCTVMFRKPKVLPVFPNVTYGDWFLYCSLLSEKSSLKAFRSGQLLSVYRVHSGGVMASINSDRKYYETHLAQIMTIYKTFNVKYKKEDVDTINHYHYNLMNIYLRNKEIRQAFKLLLSNFVLCGSKTNIKGYLSMIKRQFIKY